MMRIAESIAAEWRTLDVSGLQFWQRDTAQVVLIALVAAAGFFWKEKTAE